MFCILSYQVGFVLEGVVQVGDPPPISPYQDVPLLLEAGGLGPLEHLPLVQDLEGEHPVGAAELDHADLAKGASSDDLQDLEVVLAEAEGLDAVGDGLNWKTGEKKRESVKKDSKKPTNHASFHYQRRFAVDLSGAWDALLGAKGGLFAILNGEAKGGDSEEA